MGLFRRPRLGQQLPLSGAVKATIVVEDEGERALASTTIDRLQRPLASLLQGAGATRRPFRIPSRLLRPRHRLACGLLHASVSSWSVARAEAALVIGSYYPDRVRLVAAWMPTHVVWEGIDARARFGGEPAFASPGKSRWSLNGKPLPFVRKIHFGGTNAEAARHCHG